MVARYTMLGPCRTAEKPEFRLEQCAVVRAAVIAPRTTAMHWRIENVRCTLIVTLARTFQASPRILLFHAAGLWIEFDAPRSFLHPYLF